MISALHTDRLTLTPFSLQDVGLAIELFTDPKVVRHALALMDEEAIRDQMPTWTRRGGNGGLGIWCISESSSGDKLGTGALLPMPIEEHDTDFERLLPGQMPDNDIEVGLFLKPSAWGKGYATEACEALLQVAFRELSLDEVVATHDPLNTASREVLLKAGFKDLGTRRCYGETSPDLRVAREQWLTSRR